MSESSQGQAAPENQTADSQGAQAKEAENQTSPSGQSADGVFAQNQSEERLYAGKYKSVEDLEKAYGEAQKLIGAKTKPKEGAASAPDYADLGRRFKEQQATGQFDADVSQVLEAFGYKPEDIRLGQEAVKQQNRSKAEKELGRSVDWDAWKKWALTNVSQAQEQAVAALISEGDYSLLDKLVAQFEGASQTVETGKVGTTPTKSSGNPSERTPFSSQKEMSEAIAKASASNDFAAWQLIEARLKVTPDRLKTNLERK